MSEITPPTVTDAMCDAYNTAENAFVAPWNVLNQGQLAAMRDATRAGLEAALVEMGAVVTRG